MLSGGQNPRHGRSGGSPRTGGAAGTGRFVDGAVRCGGDARTRTAVASRALRRRDRSLLQRAQRAVGLCNRCTGSHRRGTARSAAPLHHGTPSAAGAQRSGAALGRFAFARGGSRSCDPADALLAGGGTGTRQGALDPMDVASRCRPARGGDAAGEGVADRTRGRTRAPAHGRRRAGLRDHGAASCRDHRIDRRARWGPAAVHCRCRRCAKCGA